MKKVMKNKKVMVVVGVVVLAVALLPSGVIANPPTGSSDPPVASKINYQGQLMDSAGNPLDGTYDMEFWFYDAATNGNQVGSTINKSNVQVTNGLFNVKLDVDQSDFNGQVLWLEVMVGGETLDPRQEILPVPYALSLKPGAEIQGEGSPGNAMLSVTNSGNGYGIYGGASNTGDVQNYGGYFVAEGSNGRGVYGKAANTGDAINYGGFFYASGVEGRGVFGQSAGSSGIGVKGWASDEGDVTNYGGHFTAAGENGIGVYGWAESISNGDSYGGWFETESHSGKAVYGKNNANGNYGYIGGSVEGIYGFGMWQGVLGEAYGGNGVVGRNTETGEIGMLGADGSGVRGNSYSRGGVGVRGYATGLFGIGVSAYSESGVAISAYSESGAAISARGTGVIESTADSYIFISGNSFIKNRWADVTLGPMSNGAVLIDPGESAGLAAISAPITLPGVLYGQEVTVEELTIYYTCRDGTQNFISETRLNKQIGAEGSVSIVSDDTDRKSNTPTSYTLTLAENNVLSSDQGILCLDLWLDFANDLDWIIIGGVRLRLGHN